MNYQANPARYDHMNYRRCGQSGLQLPAITLGLWHNFGDATPLTQGLLTNKYLHGRPQDARINRPGGGSFKTEFLSDQNLRHAQALNDMALARGQSLAQTAVAWVLRDARVSSALIGASQPAQVSELVGALAKLDFSDAELATIDQHAVDGGINLWRRSSAGLQPTLT